jgi:hypothetical protein
MYSFQLAGIARDTLACGNPVIIHIDIEAAY